MRHLFKTLTFALLITPLIYAVGYGLAFLLYGEAQLLLLSKNWSAEMIIFAYLVVTIVLTLLVILLTRKRKRR